VQKVATYFLVGLSLGLIDKSFIYNVLRKKLPNLDSEWGGCYSFPFYYFSSFYLLSAHFLFFYSISYFFFLISYKSKNKVEG
jgi:hypothetical protein